MLDNLENMKYNKTNEWSVICMENEIKEILMQLVDTTNKLSEGQKQLFEGQKRTDERLDKMSADISDLKKGQKRTNDRIDEQYDMIYQLTLNGEKMHNDIISTQADVRSIKLELENKVSPSIKTLCELQLDNSKRLHKLESDMQDLNDQLAIGEVLHGLKENNLI